MSKQVARDERADEGLSLIEVMVSITVFAIAASAIAMGLVYAKQSVRDSRLRIQAANLASRESEIVRNIFTASASGPSTLGATSVVVNANPLSGGTAGQPLVVDNTPFTVTRSVQWEPAGAGGSPCDGGTAVTYPTLAVHVEVTWPRMGSTKPVATNTILTPPKGTLSGSLAFVAVKVSGADGSGTASLPVTLSGASGPFTRYTEPDGCAVFSLTTPGSYTATVNTAGYVSSDGNTSASKPVTVAAGGLALVPFAYDRAATLATTLTTLTGYALPSTLPPITVYNSGLPAPTYSKSYASSGVSGSISLLWPFLSGYNMWTSACAQADPATAGATRPAALPLTSGATVAASVALSPVDILVTDSAGNAVPGATVIATPVSTTGCLSAENPLSLGATDATGALKTSVPAGKYTLSVSGRTPASSWPKTAAFSSYTSPVSYGVVVQ